MTEPAKAGIFDRLRARFGWLDHDDWIAQTAATGQAARLRAEAYRFKLRTLYSATALTES